MKILIDARMYGLKYAGIGRYVMNLINQLQQIDKENDYLILQIKNSKLSSKTRLASGGKIQNYNSKFKIIDVNISHYSLREQLDLPRILNKLDFDIAHFTHFNVPVFLNKPYVLTIHDLIKHTSIGPQTTTRNPITYWIKYWGYKIVFRNAARRARKIIVPSNVVKDELIKEYNRSKDKITVIYEGVDDIFKSKIKDEKVKIILKKYSLLNKDYIIYTGSAYPHKNLERLIEAVKQINSDKSVLNLVIVSSRNVFTERLRRFIKKTNSGQFVSLLGFVEDSELAELYKNAKAFVFSSLSEGFGLPGLEAMASGCPVICSDIPVFHEIYADAASYFNPHDPKDMANKINEVIGLSDQDWQIRIKSGKKRAEQFSWRKMAEETFNLYKTIA